MNEFWTPEYEPPQVSPEAHDKVVNLVYSNGLKDSWGTFTFLFRDRHRPLRDYMAVFGVDEEGEPYSDYRPAQAFRVGGILAGLAYLESGYDQGVDDTAFSIGLIDAEFEGIPEIYITQLSDDLGLQKLVESVSPVADLGFGVIDDESYMGAIQLGAGCVRHFMKHALEAA